MDETIIPLKFSVKELLLLPAHNNLAYTLGTFTHVGTYDMVRDDIDYNLSYQKQLFSKGKLTFYVLSLLLFLISIGSCCGRLNIRKRCNS